MDTIETQAELIRNHERRFANRLAVQLIPTRNVSVWMILIPFLLVFHLYEMKRLSKARKEFADGFMIAVERALSAAIEKVKNKEQPDYRSLAALPSIPESAHDTHEAMLRIMAEDYITLLRSKGASFRDLAKNAYKNKLTYLAEMRARDEAVRAYTTTVQAAALPPGVEIQDASFQEVLSHLEKATQELRRRDAESLFSD